MPKPNMSVEKLKTLLSYDPITGKLHWLVSRGKCKKGDEAGCLNGGEYVVIGAYGKLYMGHQIAWALHHGVWPLAILDHKNGIRHDNRIDNLREATYSQNIANVGITKANKSGRRGVCWIAKSRKWQAGIKVQGKSIHLGWFDAIDDASKAYEAAARLHFGEFTKAAA